jgi:prepilin-type N-terminal cleavage/methylation domain-containing protein
MARCARAGASSEGFTLLEVMLAVVVLATAATAIMAIYIHCVDQATAARDATYGVSVARNALNEGLAGLVKETKDGVVPDRPMLAGTYEESDPQDKNALTSEIKAEVKDRASGGVIVSYSLKKANYQAPEEQNAVDENGNPVVAGPESGGIVGPEGGQPTDDSTK